MPPHLAIKMAAACVTGLLLAGPAGAQTRIISEVNGWRAYDGTTERGTPLCGLETRDPNTGRHFLLQQVAGQGMPTLRLSRPEWNLGASTRRTVRIVIDRRVFTASATGAGQEMSWPAALDSFESAFRAGRYMRVEFPSGPDSSWHLSLTGTNAVMSAFMGCQRMLVIQPGGTAPAPEPPTSEPLRPPAPAVPYQAPAPSEAPSYQTPSDKPVGPSGPPPAGKAPDAKEGLSQGSPIPL